MATVPRRRSASAARRTTGTTSSSGPPSASYPLPQDDGGGTHPPYTEVDAITIYDYLPTSFSSSSPPASAGVSSSCCVPGEFKLLQWNIERGYKLDGIIEELKRIDADVLLLQELDIECERTDFINVPLEIAKALNLYCAFSTEFVELDHEQRKAENAVGKKPGATHLQCIAGQGYHGNAILSKFRLQNVKAIPHSENLDWEKEGLKLREPRRGHRSLLYASIDLPLTRSSSSTSFIENNNTKSQKQGGGNDDEGWHTIHCINLHLEVFAGPLLRASQLGDAVVLAAEVHQQQQQQQEKRQTSKQSHDGGGGGGGHSFIIFGDLNTMAHGLPRLSPKYCTDRVRILGVGESEAEWLQRHFLSRTVEDITSTSSSDNDGGTTSPPSNTQKNGVGSNRTSSSSSSSAIPGRLLGWLKKRFLLGEQRLSQFDQAKGLNFMDPFDLRTDVTMNHPDYYGWVTGKLDWCLVSDGVDARLPVVSSAMGNHAYHLSDHKWLQLTVHPLPLFHPFTPVSEAVVMGDSRGGGGGVDTTTTRGGEGGRGRPTTTATIGGLPKEEGLVTMTRRFRWLERQLRRLMLLLALAGFLYVILQAVFLLF